MIAVYEMRVQSVLYFLTGVNNIKQKHRVICLHMEHGIVAAFVYTNVHLKHLRSGLPSAQMISITVVFYYNSSSSSSSYYYYRCGRKQKNNKNGDMRFCSDSSDI